MLLRQNPLGTNAADGELDRLQLLIVPALPYPDGSVVGDAGAAVAVLRAPAALAHAHGLHHHRWEIALRQLAGHEPRGALAQPL